MVAVRGSLGVAPQAREVRKVVRGGVARRTGSPSPSVSPRIDGEVSMVEYSALETGGVVAQSTVGWEARRSVIRIGRRVEPRQMATRASGSLAFVHVVGMTRSASQRAMRTHQGK